MARFRVLTRRKTGIAHNIFQVDDLIVDIRKHLITLNGTTIELSAKEFSLLEYLIQNQGIVLSREKIEEHVWNFDYEGASNIVDVYIRYLRKKIDHPCSLKLIHTIRGYGYVLREEP